jgi:Ion channel
MAGKSEWPAGLWRLVMVFGSFWPLAFMAWTDPWPWPNSYFVLYLVTVGLAWSVRIISIYKLVGSRARKYRELALRRHGRGATFFLFIGTVFLITSTFATLYWALSGRTVSAFTEPLSRIDAVYFAATVFTTTGFGDIRAVNDLARVVVTLQMFLGFAFVVGAIGLALSNTTSRAADVPQEE